MRHPRSRCAAIAIGCLCAADLAAQESGPCAPEPSGHYTKACLEYVAGLYLKAGFQQACGQFGGMMLVQHGVLLCSNGPTLSLGTTLYGLPSVGRSAFDGPSLFVIPDLDAGTAPAPTEPEE